MDKQYIQHFIGVDFQNISSNIKELSTNTAWLLSIDETVNDIQDKIYKNEFQVAEDFATTTNTYKFAKKFFKNGGVGGVNSSANLFISKLDDATEPTRAYTRTAIIDTAKLDLLKVLSDGEFSVVIKDALDDIVDTINITGLDFTKSLLTIDKLLYLINRKLNSNIGVVKTSDNKLEFYTTYYENGLTVNIQSIADGTGTDLTDTSYFNITEPVVASTVGTVDIPALLTRLTDMQFAQYSSILSTSFQLTDLQAITIAQHMKTLSNKIQFIHSIDARNIYSDDIYNEFINNEQFWSGACLSNSNTENNIDTIYLTQSICATQLSTNVFDKNVKQELTQITGKKVDNDNSINSMNYRDHNNVEKRQLMSDLIDKGFLVNIPVNDNTTYLLKSKTKYINGVAYDFTNNVFITMLENSIRLNFIKYIQKNNILNNLSNISMIALYIDAEVLASLSGTLTSPIQPFTGNFNDISLNNPPMNSDQINCMKENLSKNGYFIHGYILNQVANLYIAINTQFGLSFIQVNGNNITS